MTLFKSLGLSAALVAALAITGGVALANSNGDDKKEGNVAFMRLPSVTIGANGNALVRGAEVTNITDGTITARTEWNNGSLTWNIDTDSGTDFVDRDNTEGDLNDIDNGDVISFAGVVTGGLTVDANMVREWPDEDEVANDRKDEGKHKGWNHKVLNFWNNFKFHF